jgi:NAD(P) transhydrogenase subunit alpha
VPNAASVAFSHNVAALLLQIVHDGALVIDPSNEIQAGVLVTHNGEVVHPAVREILPHAPVLVGAR